MLTAIIAYISVGFCVAVQQRKAMREASDRRTATDTDPALFHLFINAEEGIPGCAKNNKPMTEQDVMMYISSNKDFLPQQYLPMLREKLLKMDESRWANVNMISFQSPMTLLLVSIFLGGLGVDRFMLGSVGAGIGKLLTGGGCGIWWLIDLFNIQDATRQKNWAKLQPWL